MMNYYWIACLTLFATTAYAFTLPSSSVRLPTTQISESFGLDFAEDSYENTPEVILGEANYKQWINKVDKNAFLNRQYNILRRVRELNLLGATADAGILSSLEANGVDLVTLEKVLPVLEDLGLLSIAANNQQLLVNLVGFLLVEGAPFLLPVVAGALKVGPPAFYAAAAAAFGLDAYMIVNDVEIPFVGLSAGFYLGLLLVPLGAISGAVGVTLAGLKK